MQENGDLIENTIAMPMVLERMLQNEIPEFLQIIRRDVFLLAGEIQGFVQAAIKLRQKRLAFSVCGRYKNRVTSCPLMSVVLGLRLEGLLLIARVNSYLGDLMKMMRFV